MLETQFNQYLSALGLSVDSVIQEKLLAYLSLLKKWNKTYNLTAILDPEKMLTHHLVDSLSIHPYVLGERLLDVGTGAGLPGIPLALLFPEKQVTLLDSLGKKIRFLTHVVQVLSIKNVQIVQERVENYHTDGKFDAIICRAVGTVSDLLDKTQHLIASDGVWLLMKGQDPVDELKVIHKPFQCHRLHVPGMAAQRHLVVVSNEES